MKPPSFHECRFNFFCKFGQWLLSSDNHRLSQPLIMKRKYKIKNQRQIKIPKKITKQTKNETWKKSQQNNNSTSLYIELIFIILAILRSPRKSVFGTLPSEYTSEHLEYQFGNCSSIFPSSMPYLNLVSLRSFNSTKCSTKSAVDHPLTSDKIMNNILHNWRHSIESI